MDAAIWGLLGTVVGALTSVLTTWVAARSESNREQQKLYDERVERARAFQRQTLIDLQEAIHDALRLVNQAHLEDRRAYRQGERWGRNKLPETVDEGLRVARRRVSILIERVAIDDLRAQLTALMASSTQVLLAGNREEADSYMEKSSKSAQDVLVNVGAALRKNYQFGAADEG